MRQVLVAVWALVLFNSAQAERMTLQQLVDKALVTDPRISERERLVDAARGLKKEAEAHQGVSLNANTFLGIAPAVDGGFFEDAECVPGVEECKVRDDRFDLVDGLSLWGYAEFALIKPLNTFGKVENYARAADANVNVKHNDVRLQRGATIVDVKRAYYGYLASDSTVLFLKDIRQRVENAELLVENWLEEGEGQAKQSDLYAIQTAKSVVDAYIAQAQGLKNISMAGMKVLAGIPNEEPLEVAASRIRPLPLPEKSLQELRAAAMENRPEMRQVEAGMTARRALVEANKSMRKPNLYAGLAGLFSYAPGRDRLDNPYIYDPFNDYGLTPMIGVQWQWEPGVQSARVDQAEAELSAMIEKKTFARQGIPFQVEEAFNQVNAYYNSVKSLEQGARAARRWMISSYTDFEAGLETSDKLVAAFQGYVLAYTEYLETVFDYNMHHANLDIVTGAYQ